MIYLNNAATSYPKPDVVKKVHAEFLDKAPGSLYRSSGEHEDVFGECRKNLAALLGISDSKRIFFTSGATDSFNFLLSGLGLSGKKIITTATEHNCVLRPLYNMKKLADCSVEIIPCDEYGFINPEDLKAAITPDTAAVIVNHCSNVTGAVQDIETMRRFAHSVGALFIVDASQSSGCVPVYTDKWQVDALVFTGHKSLFGVQGTGGFYLKDSISLEAFRFGGTGTDGRRLVYESSAPYEVGTQNEAGIAALSAGVNYILDEGLVSIIRKEQELYLILLEGLSKLPLIKLYSGALENNLEKDFSPVISFTIDGINPSDIGYILFHSYNITVRTGFHCCPLIHDYIGTSKFGTVRCSLSFFNDLKDIKAFLKAITEIHQSLKES
ncbi:MAG: aminotransferase class V-fold PLP-dependent enzyme [Spirochaetales bacterium]|nr:aminotransferase class V-fold PLP-dependent enzyme [Spirochaetales bacterium]